MASFRVNELEFFNAKLGAHSSVTVREAEGDKAVTLDQYEKNVLFSLYPADSFTRVGGAVSDNKSPTKIFHIYDVNNDTYVSHELAIKYPKATGNELRLYFNRPSNFYPNSHQDWFIFTRDNEDIPFIGFCSSLSNKCYPKGETHNLEGLHNYDVDNEHDAYLRDVNQPVPKKGTVSYTITAQNRHPRIGSQLIAQGNYRCEVDNSHWSFISGVSGQKFMEVHHLIPISKSDEFKYSLDVRPNLVVLCPNCHKAFHHGSKQIKQSLLFRFYTERCCELKQAGIDITLEQLYMYYSVN
ncbi:HNH endonuclease [Photobacterium chitinilyticum]|uniref:HNH endonuclease n=1 Tax=Photobacterium chitinilyticum TaxID=2485123 RepID=UPI003D109F0D